MSIWQGHWIISRTIKISRTGIYVVSYNISIRNWQEQLYKYKIQRKCYKTIKKQKKEIILMNSMWDLLQQIWALETQKKILYDSLRKFYLFCNDFTLGGLRSKEPAGITILRVLKTVNGRSSWTFALDCQVNLRSWETSNDLTAYNSIVFLVWHVPSLAHRLSLS